MDDQRIKELLKKRKEDAEKEPSLEERFRDQLLSVFPTMLEKEDHFFPNTFTGEDEADYLRCRGIFENKQWNKVSFEVLDQQYVQFLMLNQNGMLYYLPAFLNHFFSLRNIQNEFFLYFIGFLEGTLFTNKNGGGRDRNSDSVDYSIFETMSIEQSKLVAMFLVNITQLIPLHLDAKHAQRALTNYWGNFLLF